MQVRFIHSVQRELYSRNMKGALDVWTVRGTTECGKLILALPRPQGTLRKRRGKRYHPVVHLHVQPSSVVRVEG
jgi:hypothetical protein